MVRIEWFRGPRSELADLFALADDSPEQVRSYRDLGRCLVARAGPDVVGHLQLVADADSVEAEVKSLAVLPDRQGTGIGSLLVRQAASLCREEGNETLIVGTAAAGTRVLRFYQLLGFRLLRVERDVFSRQAGYVPSDVDGIPLRDQVWLSLALASESPSPRVTTTMKLRVARHTERLDALIRFYRDGLGLTQVGEFRDHNGYDGVFLEIPGSGAHLELTAGGGHGAPSPHPESLLVLYLGDEATVAAVSRRLSTEAVVPANPYWSEHGTTYLDPDGFGVVLVPARWELVTGAG